MNNDITIFENNQFGKIRTIFKNDELWFVAKDVCGALDITNIGNATSRLLESMKGVCTVDTLGGPQNMTIINEAGVYKLAFTSRRAEAERFTDWVASDVLPSIRKHGMYATSKTIENFLNDPDTMIKAMQNLKEERNARLEAEKKIEKNQPFVNFARCVAGSETSILIGEAAKLIAQNGIDIGEKRLFEWMRVNGYLMSYGSSRNSPTQRSIDLGILEMKERTIGTPDGRTMVKGTPYVTGKGQIYFMNKFMQNKEVIL